MSTYQYKGAGYALPAVGGGAVRLQRKIDVPALIAAGAASGLALVAAADTGVALASTGFAANDILETFWVPKGTRVLSCGEYLITAEGAVCTINAGTTETDEAHDLGGDIDGWGVFNINDTAGTVDATDDTDGYGTDNFPGGIIFIADGSIDIEFNHATDTAIFVFWADVAWLNIV